MCHVTDISQNPEHEPKNILDGPILVAVPARDDKKVEVYQFPQEKLVCVVPKVEARDTGELL